MKIGYARVSRTDQNLDLQLDALRSAGVEKIFTDKLSGASKTRPGLDDLLNVARKGDTIAIWRLDRLARSLEHLIELANRFAAAEISFVSLTEGFDTSKPSGKMIFQIIGAIAEFERNLIVERTRAGLESAKAQGKYGGRKPVLNDDKKNVLRDLLFENGRTLKQDPDYRSAARAVGVSERTVRRYAQGEYAEPV